MLYYMGNTDNNICCTPSRKHCLEPFFDCLKMRLHEVSPRKSELSKTKILQQCINVHSTSIFGGESSDLKGTYPYPPAGVSSFFSLINFRLRNGSPRKMHKHPRYPRSVSVKNIEQRLVQSRGTLFPILQKIEQFAAPS
jgi:hypothetical protein